jgi:Protein of unknown function (DUF4199)
MTRGDQWIMQGECRRVTMNKDVWKYGLLSGFALAIMMSATVPFEHHTNMHWAMVIGYTTMVLSFLIVFVGVKHYRDTECGGSISFGRAFAAGGLMMLISCVCYVTAWESLNATVEKNFAHEYAAALVKRAQKSGLQGAALDQKIAEAHEFEAKYSNPLYRASMTLLEPLPVGIVMALVTAGILRRKPENRLPSVGSAEALEN